MADNQPLVSVILPVYNGAQLIGRVVETVLAQDYSNFQLVVLDNYSSDATPEVIAAFNDPRIKYVRNGSNIGMGANFNKGFQFIEGKYVQWLSCDDPMFTGSALSKKARFLEAHPEAAFVHSRFEYIDLAEDGSETVVTPKLDYPAQPIVPSTAAVDSFLRNTGWVARFTDILFRTEALVANGIRFQPVHFADTPFTFEVLLRCDYYGFIDEVLSRGYRHHHHHHGREARQSFFLYEKYYLHFNIIRKHRHKLLEKRLPVYLYEWRLLGKMMRSLLKLEDFAAMGNMLALIFQLVFSLVARAVIAVIAVPVFLMAVSIGTTQRFLKSKLKSSKSLLPLYRWLKSRKAGQ